MFSKHTFIYFFYYTKNTHLSEAMKFIQKVRKNRKTSKFGGTRQTVAIGKAVTFSYPPHTVLLRSKNNIYQGPNTVSVTHRNRLN